VHTLLWILPSCSQYGLGLAIFQVLKAGFVFSGKAGSGLVIARLPDGSVRRERTWMGALLME
jgi:lipid-binding SYLF domain-containing protein